MILNRFFLKIKYIYLGNLEEYLVLNRKRENGTISDAEKERMLDLFLSGDEDIRKLELAYNGYTHNQKYHFQLSCQVIQPKYYLNLFSSYVKYELKKDALLVLNLILNLSFFEQEFLIFDEGLVTKFKYNFFF